MPGLETVFIQKVDPHGSYYYWL